MADFFNTHYRNKLYKKKGFEIDRLEFLEERLENITQKIEELENRKFYS